MPLLEFYTYFEELYKGRYIPLNVILIYMANYNVFDEHRYLL